MNSQPVEIVILIIFLIAQFAVFFNNRGKISAYEKIFPAQRRFRLVYIQVTPELLAAAEEDFFSPADFLNDNEQDGEGPAVSLIVSQYRSAVLNEILVATNRYLLHNRMAAADFHLIKDIAERHIDAKEEDINQTISIPLYLGLMSTMLGIIIGLYSMPSLSIDPSSAVKDVLLNDGIATLIGGVKIAMIASFAGLGLTISSSGYLFKGSRTRVEQRKNAYYSFIQTSLLPVMNQSIGATLTSLQLNLRKFNDEFSGNLRSLSGMFRNNYDALQMQHSVLQQIRKMDMAKVAGFNMEMFREINASVAEFQKFNVGMAHLNDFVATSRNLSERVTDLMKRSENFEHIAEHIEEKLDESSKLLAFLGEHFETLRQHRDLVLTSVGDLSLNVSDLFKDLEGHFRASADTLRLFTIDEIDALKNALASSRTSLSNLEFLKKLDGLDQLVSLKQLQGLSELSKLSGLGQLNVLEGISKGVDKFNANAGAQEQTAGLLQELNQSIGTAISQLDQLRQSWEEAQNHTLGARVRKLFGK